MEFDAFFLRMLDAIANRMLLLRLLLFFGRAIVYYIRQ